MDTANPRTEVLTPLEPAQVQTALERLNASAGAWHELANLLPKLDAAGYDSTAVEMETGIDRATQNVWAVSQHVRRTTGLDLPINGHRAVREAPTGYHSCIKPPPVPKA